MQGKIGNRAYFIERDIIREAPTNDLQADKAFRNGGPYCIRCLSWGRKIAAHHKTKFTFHTKDPGREAKR